jgi:hypothetical protein
MERGSGLTQVLEQDVADLLSLESFLVLEGAEKVVDLARGAVAGELSLQGDISGARLATLVKFVADRGDESAYSVGCNIHTSILEIDDPYVQ